MNKSMGSAPWEQYGFGSKEDAVNFVERLRLMVKQDGVSIEQAEKLVRDALTHQRQVAARNANRAALGMGDNPSVPSSGRASGTAADPVLAGADQLAAKTQPSVAQQMGEQPAGVSLVGGDPNKRTGFQPGIRYDLTGTLADPSPAVQDSGMSGAVVDIARGAQPQGPIAAMPTSPAGTALPGASGPTRQSSSVLDPLRDLVSRHAATYSKDTYGAADEDIPLFNNARDRLVRGLRDIEIDMQRNADPGELIERARKLEDQYHDEISKVDAARLKRQRDREALEGDRAFRKDLEGTKAAGRERIARIRAAADRAKNSGNAEAIKWANLAQKYQSDATRIAVALTDPVKSAEIAKELGIPVEQLETQMEANLQNAEFYTQKSDQMMGFTRPAGSVTPPASGGTARPSLDSFKR